MKFFFSLSRCGATLLCLATLSALTRAQDLFVASIFSDEVYRFNGTTGTNMGVFASGMDGPYGIDFGPDGNLYVGSLFAGPKTISKYNGTTGASLGTFVNLGGANPIDIRFRADGLYVTIGGSTGGIQRYDKNTGAALGAFTPLINDPIGVDWNTSGDLFVSSFNQNKIFKYNGTTGALIGTFATASLSSPYGMRFGPDGNLYVANVGSDVITRYNGTTGALMGTFASGGGLNDPTGILFGGDGHLYVASGNTNQILRYNGTTGAFMDVFATAPNLNGPVFMAFAPVPEPTSIAVLSIGALALLRRRRSSK